MTEYARLARLFAEAIACISSREVRKLAYEQLADFLEENYAHEWDEWAFVNACEGSMS